MVANDSVSGKKVVHFFILLQSHQIFVRAQNGQHPETHSKCLCWDERLP